MKNLVTTTKNARSIVAERNKDPRIKEAEELEARAAELRKSLKVNTFDENVLESLQNIFNTSAKVTPICLRNNLQDQVQQLIEFYVFKGEYA